MVAVPNAASLQARAFGDRWFHLDLPRHLVHLPAAALIERLRDRSASRSRGSATGAAARRCSAGCTAWSGTLPGRPDLYDAIRRPEARSAPDVRAGARALALGAAAALFPVAAAGHRGRGRRPPRRHRLRGGAPWLSGPTGKVIVVMPAMNAARTLERTVEAIPRDWVDEVILVDDASSDDTVELARRLPLHVVWHPHNAGYGANQKTCYLEALQRDADAVVMLHPDGQYEPELIGSMVEPILPGEADLVLGSRLAVPGMALANGMPRWKYVVNRALTDGGEPDHGHRPLRGPHRLPRLLAPAAPDRARSCATPPTSASTPSC